MRSKSKQARCEFGNSPFPSKKEIRVCVSNISCDFAFNEYKDENMKLKR
jgi:hypothetical protein